MSGVKNDGGYVPLGSKGDLSVYAVSVQFQVNDPDISAMYIRNENRKVPEGGHPAYLLLESDIWIFRPEDRERGRHRDIREMVSRLANASIALYGFDVPAYRFRIHDTILEFAEDVVRLQPPPTKTFAQHKADLEKQGMRFTIRANGKIVDG